MSSAIIGEAILGQLKLNNDNDNDISLTSEHGTRMIGYYPRVIQSIQDIQAIIHGEGPEFDELQECVESVISDAYLTTMNEERVTEWERLLNITTLEGSTIDDRRDTIIARIRGQGKLNSTVINSIVNAFTGGTANSWVKDSVLYVEITPPPSNKAYRFENVEQEIRNKIPAHMGFNVSRNYSTWGEIKESYPTWLDVKNGFDTWNDVRIHLPFKEVR